MDFPPLKIWEFGRKGSGGTMETKKASFCEQAPRLHSGIRYQGPLILFAFNFSDRILLWTFVGVSRGNTIRGNRTERF